jgi:hypothetical protein
MEQQTAKSAGSTRRYATGARFYHDKDAKSRDQRNLLLPGHLQLPALYQHDIDKAGSSPMEFDEANASCAAKFMLTASVHGPSIVHTHRPPDLWMDGC